MNDHDIILEVEFTVSPNESQMQSWHRAVTESPSTGKSMLQQPVQTTEILPLLCSVKSVSTTALNVLYYLV